MKKIVSFILCMVMVVLCICSCSDKPDETTTANSGKTESAEPVNIEMSVKDFGIMKLELYPDIAPITVENFVSLAKSGFYNGLKFHRIMKDFMIQGGAPNGNSSGDSDKKIPGEFSENGFNNPLSHDKGVISMARANDPDSASCQFFICTSGNYKSSLDGKYAAFGRVTDGMDVLDKIASVDVVMNAYGSEKSVPVHDVIIDYIKVVD